METTHQEEDYNDLLRIVNQYTHSITLAKFHSNLIPALTSYPEFIKSFDSAVKARKAFYQHPFTTGFDTPLDFEDQACELWYEELDDIPF